MRYHLHLLLLLLTIASLPMQAQKHDYMWPLGLSPGWSDYTFFLDFKGLKNPDVVLRSDPMSTGTYSASYCNAEGQILLYSNGIWIQNKFGEQIENSQGLNPTMTMPEWHNHSYPGGQSGFFLENPNNPNMIYFISLDFGFHPANAWPYQFVGQNLVVATIDLQANNGAGKVTEKNRVLLTGTLMAPTACRHANGRDWWILVSDADENRHYRILLSPQGFSAPETQFIGTKPNPIPSGFTNKACQISSNCFSPSGKYYADINDILGFSIFEFDRCSGLLSNERRVDYPAMEYPNNIVFYKNGSGSGAVFSPNDSFFYKTSTVFFDPISPSGSLPYLWQYDLSSTDLQSTVDTINIIDSSVYHYPTNITTTGFYGAELAPDGRIYIVHSGDSYTTVQYPNLKGKSCHLIQDKPYFGVTISEAIPYLPNYRLGPLDGSSCDTLGLNNVPVANFRVDDTLDLLSQYFYDLSHHEPAAWKWDFGDGNTSTEQNPIHQYGSPGIYEVCLTVSNQYGENTYCRTLYLGVSATANPVLDGQVAVFPNPFSNRLEVKVGTPLQNPVFMLYDITGRLVRLQPIKNGANEIQTPDLNPGMYFWQVFTNGQSIMAGKVIKAE